MRRAAAWAAVLLLGAGAAGGAGPAAAAPPRPCAGVYSGSARGTFRCRVVAEHHAAIGISRLTIEVEGDPSGDALAIQPGGLEWIGALAPGSHASAGGDTRMAWSLLKTGLPGQETDFVASKGWPSHPGEKGEVSVTLTQAVLGPGATGVQRFEVHGTFSARLLPALPGAVSPGPVRVQVTF